MGLRIAVCWKWVSLDGEDHPDDRWAGVSAADEAALEVALRLADTRPGSAVTVFCLGPDGADEVLRQALAAGADDAVRIDASPRLDSHVVADALAAAISAAAGDRVDLVVCGDQSVDRGTGATPVFLATELGVAQALGLVSVATELTADDTLRVTRRLDGGRREILDVALPAVVSVEGAVARLRRAPLSASLASRSRPITTVRGPHGTPADPERHPYRPRPRTLPAPRGDALDRVRQLLDVGGGDHHAELVTLDPPEAAARIVAQLREWGYLEAAD